MPPALRLSPKKSRGFDLALGLGLTALMAILFFLPLNFFEGAHSKLYDLSLQIRGSLLPLKELIIVSIDDSSVASLGRWPWPRKAVAELISNLSEAGAKVIAVDLVFLPAEAERVSGYDRLLGETIQRAGNVILPYYFTMGKSRKEEKREEILSLVISSAFLLFDDPQKFSDFPPPFAGEIFASVPEISRGARTMGHINVLPDPDGKVRWEPLIIQYDGHYYPSFSLQVAASAMGLTRGDIKVNVGDSLRLGKITIPTNSQGKMLIPYYGGNQIVPQIPYIDVLSKKIPPDSFRGKIVLVGVSAAGAHDFLATPFSPRLLGVEKHAQTIMGILEGRLISRPAWTSFVELGMVLLLGVLFTLLLPRMRPAFQLVLSMACILALGVWMVGAISQGIWIRIFFPGFLVIIQYILATARRAPVGERKAPAQAETNAVAAPKRAGLALSEATLRMEKGGPLKKIDRYEVLGELGHGAMGVVYKGRDPIIDRLVAVKTIRFDRFYEEQEVQGLKDRFFKEAQAAGKLAHSNIVTIFDVGEDRGLCYMAMEFVEGDGLSKFTSKDRLLPVEEVLEMIAQSAEALDYAHQQKIVHRDIKPANIMRTFDGRIKVMDFGIAKLPSSTLTQAGSILGTPAYMSPEQIMGKDLDGRSDLFSLASILYELLTGIKPFRGETLEALSQQINHENPLPPSQQNPLILPAVDAILRKAMAKAPADRYGRGTELAQALRRVIGDMKKNPP
jgi:serine/threonine-protein kinase